MSVEQELVKVLSTPEVSFKHSEDYWRASRIVESADFCEKRTVISTLFYLSDDNVDVFSFYWNISDIEMYSLPKITKKVKKYFYDVMDVVMEENDADKIVTEWYVGLLINKYPNVMDGIELVKNKNF